MSERQNDFFDEPETVTPEAVEPIFIDHKLARLERTTTFWRAPFGGSNGGRFYFRKGVLDFYAGYSLWTKSVLPTAPSLIAWQIAQGDEGKVISLAAREYGSIFHLFVARHERLEDEFRFKVNGKQSQEWRDYIRGIIDHLGLPKTYIEDWESKLKNDMTAYFRWKREHQVNVLAVEVPVWNDEYKIATPLDMVVQCLVKASPYAKAPTVPAVAAIDFKTGDGGVDYDEYKLQLGFVRLAWNEIFQDTPYQITHALNWSPKKRSMSPAGYNFINQTDRFTDEQIRHYAKTCSLMGFNRPTGKVLDYRDSEDGPVLEIVHPLDWLKNFFGDGKA